MKTMLGEIFNYEPNANIQTNMETVNIISSTVYDSYLKVISKFKGLNSQNNMINNFSKIIAFKNQQQILITIHLMPMINN